jgi:error-prone DNA polymerase
VARAQALRYAALAITDECSLGGVVRAHAEAKRLGLPLIVGATMQLAARSTLPGPVAASAAAPASFAAPAPTSSSPAMLPLGTAAAAACGGPGDGS